MIEAVVIEAVAMAGALKMPRQRPYPLVRTVKQRWNRAASLVDVSNSSSQVAQAITGGYRRRSNMKDPLGLELPLLLF